MNNLEAYKMDGLGNDFIIFDKREKSLSLSKEQIIKISDRNNIGCDQVIFIDKDQKNDAYLQFYNSDGGEISACGNGSRSVAYFLMLEKKQKKLSCVDKTTQEPNKKKHHNPNTPNTPPARAALERRRTDCL